MPTEQLIDPVQQERFARFVTTRRAALLCDRCGRGHVPHTFDSLECVRNAIGDIQNVQVMFRCDRCGARRQWGQIGPRPESETVDD